jgi:hypothetical protein
MECSGDKGSACSKENDGQETCLTNPSCLEDDVVTWSLAGQDQRWGESSQMEVRPKGIIVLIWVVINAPANPSLHRLVMRSFPVVVGPELQSLTSPGSHHSPLKEHWPVPLTNTVLAVRRSVLSALVVEEVGDFDILTAVTPCRFYHSIGLFASSPFINDTSVSVMIALLNN